MTLADQCGTCQDSSGKFTGGLCLNGTPVTSCPGVHVDPNTSGSTSTVMVQMNTQSNAPQPTAVPIAVTATPALTAIPQHIYKYYPLVRVVSPTTSPSIIPTNVPKPTSKPKHSNNASRLTHGFFQNIEGFFQGFESWFFHLGHFK